MKTRLRNQIGYAVLALGAVLCLPAVVHADAPITHQITLGTGQSWCSDSIINGLFDQINAYRSQNGVPALLMDTLGMKDAELRAVQFAAYMQSNPVGSPGFNPHTGYQTTAASIGYNVVQENLAYMTSDPAYIVFTAWDDTLHIQAMLATDANIAGVSCIYSGSIPYLSYDPGCSPSFCGQTLPVTPPTVPAGTLDAQEWDFLTLINNYRQQNGAGALKVSATLQNSSQWMANDMASNNYVSHTDSLGRTPATRLADFNYPYAPWGENIAGGYTDAQSMFTGFQTACDPDSNGNCTYAHRANMLNPAFQAIGIGRAYGASSSYGWYWATDFGGVVDQTINPPAAGSPVIGSFTASPATIGSGQSSTLSWSISGATTISISNGVGNVSTVNSISVSPAQTTTYTLTATNSAGSVTAVTTVTVSSGAPVTGDKQPPSMPTLVSAIAKSSTEVDLTWTTSTDNVSVAGYHVVRNGSVLTSVTGGALTYADTTVVGGTTYTYDIVAYDAAGNQSTASNSMQATTPGTCPAPATNAFTGCYYTNATLSGGPSLIRTDSQINFDWYSNPPGPPVSSSSFSIQWQGNFTFATAGTYNFTATVSDGMRVYLDGAIILDGWKDQEPRRYWFSATVTQGTHLLTVAYYDETGSPTAHLTWQSAAPAATPAPVISSFTASPATITSGQSSTLSWNVTGATTLTLDNGIGSISGTSKSVSPTKTTTYTLTATNSTGSVTAKISVTVNSSSTPTPPSTPAPGTCPAPATNAFTGCYYNSLNLTGNPVLARTDSQINFDWAGNSPSSALSSQFSVRWEGNFTFAAGTYTFTLTMSDGMRVYVDGTLVFNRWVNYNPPMVMAFHQTLTQGTHLITVEYYESTGDPTAHVTWAKQ